MEQSSPISKVAALTRRFLAKDPKIECTAIGTERWLLGRDWVSSVGFLLLIRCWFIAVISQDLKLPPFLSVLLCLWQGWKMKLGLHLRSVY